MHSWIRFAANASIITVFILVACTIHTGTNASTPKNSAKLNDIPPDPACDASYMVVSTIDGKVSGLDLRRRGQLSWSIEADMRPLVSSSLSNLELVRNGKKLRLIPALDGAIYQFDGDKVEPLPMSAETLLSSTYQLSDDAMIVGSKSLQNFGVDFKTGEVHFMCDSDGCSTNSRETGDTANGSDVVVVTRVTQTVRSVDIKNGLEKWNFSVGEHQLSLPNTDSHSQIEDHFDKNADELPHFLNGRKAKQCPTTDDLGDENFLRLVVPEGKVVALNKQDSTQVAWEHKFGSPIAKAWLLRRGKLHVMNLFTEQHIPTMSTFTPDDIESDSSTQPLLYIGSHQKLLYIQPSPGMEAVLKMYSGKRIGHVFDSKVKVAWRPYLNTASVRTPIFRGNKPGVDHKKGDNKENKKQNSLAVWHEEYPFDTGYFLYPEFRDSRSTKKPMLIEDLQRKLDSSMSNYLWTYRKEITVAIAFTLLMSLAIDFLMTNILFPRKQLTLVVETKPATNSFPTVSEAQLAATSQESSMLMSSSSKSVNSLDDYVSRFETDFDCVQCLGKGGFGVVMEAVNKVDDQHYAVKRIKLPKSEGAKEKVLREVRALAKLEHVGIVRYFNAWVESPPAGWQEEKDLDLGLSDTSRQTITQLTASPATSRYASHLKKSGKRKSSPVETINEGSDDETTSNDRPHHQMLDMNTNTDSVVFAYEEPSRNPRDDPKLPGSGSGEFVVHSDITDSGASSDDAGFALIKPYMDVSQQSFVIEDEESRSCSISSVPFSNYSKSSVDLPDRNDEYSVDDSVVFDNQSKSLSKHCDNLGQSGIHFTLSSGGNENEEQTDQRSDVMGAKFFLYIQMQLYRKDTLKDWLHNNTLNRDRMELMGIFDQILCAVDYVHSCGLMHRDLKPSNIFFSSDGVVKVGDFGLVTPLSVQDDEGPVRPESPSSTGQTHTADVGTTLYMSPEQIARKPYNLKVDVFSSGLIFLELCMPFSTQMERIRTLQDAKNHILPGRFERELPTECDLVRKMTSECPTHRPEIKDIMAHPLLKDLAPTRFVHHPRTRTISNDSSDSTGLPIHD